MSTLEGQWIDVFRAGDYGDKGTYTPADLDAMVTNYDPARHEAPVVLGHPEPDAPAFGWVATLRRVGDTLQAKLRQIAPQFEAMVREGRFKKRSVAFYRTASGLALRHLGFLGAMPPEVKGLRDLQLCEFHDSGTFTAIEFQDLGLDALSNFRFNPTAGIVIDPHSVRLLERTNGLMEKNSNLTFGEALRQARKELGDWAQKNAPGKFKFNQAAGIPVDPHSVKVLERINVLMKENSNLAFGEAARQARKELSTVRLP